MSPESALETESTPLLQTRHAEAASALSRFARLVGDSPPAGLVGDSPPADLRASFDGGRALGLSLRVQGPWQPAELARWLSTASLPCLSGPWQQRSDAAWELRRPPCAAAQSCASWREALDGLVMGAGDSLRYARHFSASDGLCLDLLYDAQTADLRWAPIPETHQAVLGRLQARLAAHQAGVELLGYAEGTVFYRLHDRHPQLRQHRHGFLLRSVRAFVAAEAPGLDLFETSPRAIWEGD